MTRTVGDDSDGRSRALTQDCSRPTSMSTANHCPIPPELIEIIVSHLHDDIDALRKCCIVDRTFRSFSQPLLFSSVTLRECYDDDPRVNSLVEAFKSSPHLARHVETLRFRLYTMPGLLPELLGKMDQIRTLELSTHGGYYWHNLPTQIRQAFIELVLPNVRHLIVGEMWLPWSTIYGTCTHLDHLTLIDTDQSRGIYEHETHVTSCPSLRSLTLMDYRSRSVVRTASWVHLLAPSSCRIESLELISPLDNTLVMDVAGPFISRFRDSLVHLSLGAEFYSQLGVFNTLRRDCI